MWEIDIKVSLSRFYNIENNANDHMYIYVLLVNIIVRILMNLLILISKIEI